MLPMCIGLGPLCGAVWRVLRLVLGYLQIFEVFLLYLRRVIQDLLEFTRPQNTVGPSGARRTQAIRCLPSAALALCISLMLSHSSLLDVLVCLIQNDVHICFDRRLEVQKSSECPFYGQSSSVL